MKIKLYLLELAFILLLFVTVLGLLLFIRVNIQTVEQVSPEIERWGNFLEQGNTQLDDQASEDVSAITDKVRSALIKIITGFILAITAFILLSSLIKSYQWSFVSKHKITKQSWLRLSGLLTIWYSAWILLLTITTFALKTANIAAAYFIIIIGFYFTIYLTPCFLSSKTIFKTIKATFKIGIQKFYRLFWPFLLNISVFYVFISLFLVLYSAPLPFFILSWIIFALFLAWQKTVIFKVIKDA
ncbi:MAG: hypothetical protein KJ601_02435 [Nanoarchaeota archaeon]|nr:hypothetical protein [Nanoarchaeota archaeon]MBU1704840.1 hypothetical protein [Nanoarchaeota archaeon]